MTNAKHISRMKQAHKNKDTHSYTDNQLKLLDTSISENYISYIM